MQDKNINPFIGLRSFQEHENHLFFGRDVQIKNIIDNLIVTNFATIIGYSGSGKSSLVRSGIMSSLAKKFPKGHPEYWNIGVINPGNDPIHNLAKALLQKYPEFKTNSKNEINEVSEILSQPNSSIIKTIKKLNKNHSGKLLLIIDQFEEIFRFTKTKDIEKSIHFVNLLLGAFKNKEDKLYIMLTLRSDFIGNCTEFEGLPEALNQSQYLIPKLNTAQFKEVINGPLAKLNFSISDPLLQVLLDEIINNQDQLPILQHAMMRTFAYWNLNSSHKQPIDVLHYKAIGSMKKALSNHADEAFNELNTEEKTACEKIFKVLSNFEAQKVTRNPLAFSKLVEITDFEPRILLNVINTFRRSDRSFLSPKEDVAITDTSIIDISHESLLRLWARLQSWTKEEMESSATYKKLCETAEDYQEGRGSLLINPELAIVLKWREKELPTEEWAKRYNLSYPRAINFLEDSKIKFDQELLKKSLEQSRKTKLNKLIISFMSIALIVCITLGAYAFLQKEEAINNKEKAILATKSATANAVRAEESAEKAEIAAENARQKEIEAISAKKSADINAIAAKGSAEKADIAAENARQKEKEAIESKRLADISAYSADSSARVALTAKIKAEKEEQKATRLKNVSDAIKMAFEAEKNLDLNKIDSAIVQSKRAHNLFITNGNLERENQIYSALNRSLFEGKSKKDNFFNNRNSIGFSTINRSNSSHEFMSFDNSSELLFFKVDNTNKIIKLINSAFKNIDLAIYSTNGEFIICTKQDSNNNGELLIYNEKNKQLIKKFSFTNQIRSLQSFKYLNQQYISFKENNNSYLLNLNTLDYNQFQNTDKNDFFSFSGKGGYLISKKNNIALLYKVAFNQSLPSLNLIKKIKSSSNITSYQFSNDDNLLAIGNQEGIVSIYNTNDLSKVVISKHKNVKISDLNFVEINNKIYIISASYDNTINLTNIQNQDDFVTLKGHKSWVKSIKVDQENKILYSVSEDASFRYWYLDQNALENQLKN